jgi:hypothetical protein
MRAQLLGVFWAAVAEQYQTHVVLCDAVSFRMRLIPDWSKLCSFTAEKLVVAHPFLAMPRAKARVLSFICLINNDYFS